METGDSGNLNPIGLLFTLAMGVLMLVLPRRFATVPLVFASCFMTIQQQVVIAGFNFSVMRIIVLAGWIRIIIRGERLSSRLNGIDKAILAYTFVGAAFYVILWHTFGSVVNQMGFAYNVIGIYFLFRILIQDFEDIENTIKVIAFAMMPLAVVMVHEKLTGNNMFSIFGGIPESVAEREGSLRAQGPFRHPILAGTFGATSIPLLLSLLISSRRNKLLLISGIVAGVVVTVSSASSGPALALLLGITGMLAWYVRRYMRLITWGIFAAILLLHMVMKAPVWFLMARASVFSGSTGWHRANLIDQAVKHLDEWWLIGTTYTAHWIQFSLRINPDMVDITNQYIGEGVNGGLPRMFLFILTIATALRSVGKNERMLETFTPPTALFMWGIGTTLFAHAVSFLSVAYFDQMILFFYMTMAFIGSTRSLLEDSELYLVEYDPDPVYGEFRHDDEETSSVPTASG